MEFTCLFINSLNNKNSISPNPELNILIQNFSDTVNYFQATNNLIRENLKNIYSTFNLESNNEMKKIYHDEFIENNNSIRNIKNDQFDIFTLLGKNHKVTELTSKEVIFKNKLF